MLKTVVGLWRRSLSCMKKMSSKKEKKKYQRSCIGKKVVLKLEFPTQNETTEIYPCSIPSYASQYLSAQIRLLPCPPSPNSLSRSLSRKRSFRHLLIPLNTHGICALTKFPALTSSHVSTRPHQTPKMMPTPAVICASIRSEIIVPPMPELRMGRRSRREEMGRAGAGGVVREVGGAW